MSLQAVWEYRVETIGSTFKGTSDSDVEEFLNDWGKDGWDVIAFHPIYGSNKITIVAKREIADSGRRKTNSSLQW